MYITAPEITVSGVNKKGKERLIVERQVDGFDPENTIAWKTIQLKFSTGIRHPELLSIAYILEKIGHLPKITRTCRRSYVVLIKWFNENWTEIEPLLNRIQLLDENEMVISGSRQGSCTF